MINFLIRVILVALGLLFAASLAVVALLLLAVWTLRLGWAKLTGRPVTPWATVMGQRFDPRAGFERFRAAAAQRAPQPSGADRAAARARGQTGDVSDARARSVR